MRPRRRRPVYILWSPRLGPSSGMFGGVGTILVCLFLLWLLMLAYGTPARSQTVAELLRDPGMLDAVTAACRNDPGRLARQPACVNADAARLRLAEQVARGAAKQRRADQGGPPVTSLRYPPTDPRYWRMQRPDNLAAKLRRCQIVPDMPFCDAARAAQAQTL